MPRPNRECSQCGLAFHTYDGDSICPECVDAIEAQAEAAADADEYEAYDDAGRDEFRDTINDIMQEELS